MTIGNREELLALALRVEAGSGAPRILDAETHCAVRGYTMHENSDPSKGIFAFWDRGICHNCSSWSELTASIEAALWLLPEGHTWAAGDCGEDDLPWACVTQNAEPCRDFASNSAPNVASAITAACLRALASQGEE